MVTLLVIAFYVDDTKLNLVVIIKRNLTPKGGILLWRLYYMLPNRVDCVQMTR